MAATSLVVTGLAAVGGAGADAAPPGGPGGRIVDEWNPGISAADTGGRLTVDGYGVGGLGFYSLELDDGARVLAVCVQADVGHSMTARYTPDPEPTVSSPELAVLLWRYAGGDPPATDVEAAAVNVLSWRYAGAQRRGGGPVWNGDAVEIAVVGAGRRPDIEAAVAALAAEATARRGPWTLSEPTITGTEEGASVAVLLTGPGGPIGGIDVAFEVGSHSTSAVTDRDGLATITLPAGHSGPVVATASTPGPLRTYTAPGSQRLAVPTTVTVRAEGVVPAPTTTTTTTTSTTTTTEPPTTSTTTTTTTSSTTTAPPTTSPTTSTTLTSPPPSTSTSTVPTPPPPTPPPSSTPPPPPPTLPRTGAGGRGLARIASALFALGGVAVLVGARSARAARGPG